MALTNTIMGDARWRHAILGADRTGLSKSFELTIHPTGNAQLLEAAPTRAQVLPRRGGTKGATTEELHFWLPGGMCYLYTRCPEPLCLLKTPNALLTNFEPQGRN